MRQCGDTAREELLRKIDKRQLSAKETRNLKIDVPVFTSTAVAKQPLAISIATRSRLTHNRLLLSLLDHRTVSICLDRRYVQHTI